MSVRRFLAPLLMLFALAGAAPALAQDKVVYHIDNAAEQGTKALRNIRNHLDVAPKTEIRVVTHAEGGSGRSCRDASLSAGLGVPRTVWLARGIRSNPSSSRLMRLPRVHLRALMFAVAVEALLLAPIAAGLRWLHVHDAWISINGFTIRF